MIAIAKKENALPCGSIKLGGYPKELLDYIVQEQLLDEKLWKLLANQFRLHSDNDGDWRGEFWGKTMRGACLCYQLAPSSKLYRVLKNTVLDLISCQDADGRLSAYPSNDQYRGWDMWGRKYAIMGLLSFAEISKSKALTRRVVHAASRSADDIMKHVGKAKGKIDILDTSSLYGSMNSASILKDFTWLYRLTNKKKYLDFAQYIIDRGLCKGFDLLAAAESPLFPYEFEQKKAYEEISCFEGMLDMYEITGEERYFNAASSFARKLLATDFTLIGCAGCDGEFFDHSSLTQVTAKDTIMQETCVTVTLMGFLARLYELSGDVSWMDPFERAALNAYFGSINNERQKMESAKGNVWTLEGCTQAPHGSYPFDSYSPLLYGKRATQVGGFKLMQDGDTYGCCACNGARGMGVYGKYVLSLSEDKITVLGYTDAKAVVELGQEKISITMKANLYRSRKVKIEVRGNSRPQKLDLRIPSWMKKVKVHADGKAENSVNDEGRLHLILPSGGATITISFSAPLKVVRLEGKVAFEKGPIVLTRDHRLDPNFLKPVDAVVFDKKPRLKRVANPSFASNVCYEGIVGGDLIRFSDYAQAGKDSDAVDSCITVWQNTTL